MGLESVEGEMRKLSEATINRIEDARERARDAVAAAEVLADTARRYEAQVNQRAFMIIENVTGARGLWEPMRERAALKRALIDVPRRMRELLKGDA